MIGHHFHFLVVFSFVLSKDSPSSNFPPLSSLLRYIGKYVSIYYYCRWLVHPKVRHKNFFSGPQDFFQMLEKSSTVLQSCIITWSLYYKIVSMNAEYWFWGWKVEVGHRTVIMEDAGSWVSRHGRSWVMGQDHYRSCVMARSLWKMLVMAQSL